MVTGLASYPYSRRVGYQWFRDAAKRVLKPVHASGPPNASDFDRGILRTITLFIGALVGRQLSSDDIDELIGRLDFAVKHDSGWRIEYAWFARYLEEIVRGAGTPDLGSAPMGKRDLIVERVMAVSPWSTRSIALGLVSSTERNRRRMIFSTVPHLIALYARSGVPFRMRGYTSWPGVPGDPREYTRPGPISTC